MSCGVEIGCSGNPQILFAQLCKNVGISEDCFTLVEKSDIYWAWGIRPEYHDIYQRKHHDIKTVLSEWISSRKVKYASW
jgi:hypothetical protein